MTEMDKRAKQREFKGMDRAFSSGKRAANIRGYRRLIVRQRKITSFSILSAFSPVAVVMLRR